MPKLTGDEVLELVRHRFQEGIRTKTVAELLDVDPAIASHHLQRLKARGIIAVTGTAHSAVWCWPDRVESVRQAVRQEQVKRLAERDGKSLEAADRAMTAQKERRKALAEKSYRQFVDEHRVIKPAAECKVEIRGPVSVWDLAK